MEIYQDSMGLFLDQFSPGMTGLWRVSFLQVVEIYKAN